MSEEAVTTFRGLADWLLTVDPEAPAWQLESKCSGWTNQDILIHLTCTIRELVEPASLPPPDTTSIERTNDRQVACFRGGSVADDLAEYARLLPDAVAVLVDLQSDAKADETFDLFDAGVYPVHLGADALVFDHYCHLAHDATLGSVLPPIRSELAEQAIASAIQWLVAGIPQMSGAGLLTALTEPVGLRITGPGGGSWRLSASDERAVIAECVASPALPSTVIETSASDFMLWGTLRRDRAECRLALRGHTDVADAVAASIHVY